MHGPAPNIKTQKQREECHQPQYHGIKIMDFKNPRGKGGRGKKRESFHRGMNVGGEGVKIGQDWQRLRRGRFKIKGKKQSYQEPLEGKRFAHSLAGHRQGRPDRVPVTQEARWEPEKNSPIGPRGKKCAGIPKKRNKLAEGWAMNRCKNANTLSRWKWVLKRESTGIPAYGGEQNGKGPHGGVNMGNKGPPETSRTSWKLVGLSRSKTESPFCTAKPTGLRPEIQDEDELQKGGRKESSRQKGKLFGPGRNGGQEPKRVKKKKGGGCEKFISPKAGGGPRVDALEKSRGDS